MDDKVIVTAITPTGKVTLGNYIGAIKNLINVQNTYDKIFIFVADLHALNSGISPIELNENKKKIAALYLACGLNLKKTIIFNQSEVSNHSKLSQIFENFTTVGELSRMTQYKDKAKKFKQSNGTNKIVTSLLTYPVLMAADILLYNAHAIPVGLDQKQHIELTRNIASRFNNRFGLTFKLPTILLNKEGAKIMALNNPNIKMSKSNKDEKSYIDLLEPIESIKTKILRSVTDSENKIYLSSKKPGIKNLLTIYANLRNITIKEAEQKFKSYNYHKFKIEVGDIVAKTIQKIQEKYNKVEPKIDKILKKGKKIATHYSNKMIDIVYKKIGLKD
ncbi:MAG: tryptophan--tRNA ligase [Mycoplasma sp.]|nr:tryptophan--tRNA ligase [Mycoplasma sp.]